jgi:hypothetical protein
LKDIKNEVVEISVAYTSKILGMGSFDEGRERFRLDVLLGEPRLERRNVVPRDALNSGRVRPSRARSTRADGEDAAGETRRYDWENRSAHAVLCRKTGL